MRCLLTVIMMLSLLLGSSFGGEIHCKHFWHGMPLGSVETNDLIIRDCYAVSTNDETKFADWVAYKLTYREVNGTLPLKRDWETDSVLDDDETLEAGTNDDYRGAAALRYDRGHLVPLASFRGSASAQEVNLYSVVVPQRVRLNRGVWNTIEGWERDLVGRYNTVYVVSGTLYERDMPPLPSSEVHRVPSGFWKTMIFQDRFTWMSISFVVDQQVARGVNTADCLVSISDIEKRTNLTLCPDLDLYRQASFKGAVNKVFVVEHLQRQVYSE
jgi:endonuclease G